MESFKGTPAPWMKRVNPKGAIVVIIPKKYGERVIETILQTGKIYDDDCGNEVCCCVEEHANARLIANSPELLNVLIELNNSIDDYWNGGKSDALIKNITRQQQNSLVVINKILLTK